MTDNFVLHIPPIVKDSNNNDNIENQNQNYDTHLCRHHILVHENPFQRFLFLMPCVLVDINNSSSSISSSDETSGMSSSSSSSSSVDETSASSSSSDSVDSSSSSSFDEVEVDADDDDDDDDETDDDDEACQSIAQIACSNDNLSMICEQLKENALLDDLEDGLWTVFVPTNDAFQNAPLEMITSDNIEDILLGHTISNELIAFEDLLCTERTEMTNGKYTRTVCVDDEDEEAGPSKGRKTYQNGGGNDDNQRPEIIDINIPACNGIIHIVSEVILPYE